jgi:hypothetical protein
MSSSIDNVECPVCGGNAQRETDTETGEIHTWCTDCDYDSDISDDIDYDEDVYDGWGDEMDEMDDNDMENN